jgi:hypothetical protein
MTLIVHTAEELRRAVAFTDLIGPLSAAFQDYSRGGRGPLPGPAPGAGWL